MAVPPEELQALLVTLIDQTTLNCVKSQRTPLLKYAVKGCTPIVPGSCTYFSFDETLRNGQRDGKNGVKL